MAQTTKTIDGESYPASDFLVVEDPEESSKWHLQVRRHGKPDHGLMGAAHAALVSSGGHRGNKYEGPNKEEAISKLKGLYKSEGIDWPEDAKAAEMSELSFDAIRNIVGAALTKKYPPKKGDGNCLPGDGPYVRDIYPNRVIFTKDGVLFQSSFTIDDQEATIGEPEEVTEEYVASSKKLSEVRDGMIRIPVAYTGTFEKVENGVKKNFTISGSDLRQWAQRLSQRETPIDYGHNSAHTVPPGWDKAAGWFAPRMGEVEPFGTDPDTGKPREILYAWAELTSACLAAVSQKEYRYFSPEPHWNDKDEHGKPIKTHLAAGAITNRPFLKDLPPIEIDPTQYPQLLQMVALSESKRLTTTPSTVHVDNLETKPKESKTMIKKFKLRKLTDGEDKGKTGCFDESGEMVGLAEKEGGKPSKITFKLHKDGEHAGKIGCFEGDDMVGMADHRSLKAAHKALSEYDPGADEDDPEEAQSKRDAQMRERQDASNAVCLSELADAAPGQIVLMQERMAQEGRLTLPGLMKANRITKLIEDATKAGKILPKQRKAFFVMATANIEAAEAFLSDMPRPVVDTGVRGFQGSGEVVDPLKELDARVNVLMSEKKMEYGAALTEVYRADPSLKRQVEKQQDRERQTADTAQ